MQYLLKRNEMKKCDLYTSEHFKVPDICLMERAALASCEEIKKRIDYNDRLLFVCGNGNNGGDGIAIARMLYLDGYDVTIAITGDLDKMTHQTSLQLEIAQNYNITIAEDIHNIQYNTYTCIIDAIFGIGLNRKIEGNIYNIIEKINASGATVFSIDIPSGINADNGHVMGISVIADFTITFAFEKIGMYLFPASDYCGQILLKQIGITRHSITYEPELFTYHSEDLNSLLPKRKSDSNKGTYGKVTIFAGTKNMAGAAFLCALSAYKTGAGLVRIVTVEENRQILQTLLPQAVLTTYDYNNPDENILKNIIQSSTAIGCGCGLGTDENALKIVNIVLKYCTVPCVLDADALNIIAKNDLLGEEDSNKKNIIITPHLGEMSRLCNESIQEIKENIIDTAKSFSEKYKLCCVLKDTRTVVTTENTPSYVNVHGANGMATGGSGDALCGIICGLLAQKMSIFDAACAGVLIHSLAGESASKRYGDFSVTADNIIEEIATVLRSTINETI